MNVYIDHPQWPGNAISRIVTNLNLYLPKDITIVYDPDDADFTVLIIVGRRDHAVIKARKVKNYAVAQLSLKSTRNPDPEDWMELWSGAKVVWSYYDLNGKFNFYHTPLGADSRIFHPLNLEHKYAIGVTGGYTRTECIFECNEAARKLGRSIARIKDATDEELNFMYNQCDYVSGLRRKEGFEMPAAEALLCGIRPIMFDTPNYRQWFDGFAEFIPEEDMESVCMSLVKLFQEEPRKVTKEEMMDAKTGFDWKYIISGFWERCL
jgi:hypothetical protein